MADEADKKTLIIPPGLKERYETFKDHYEVAKGAPILILGPTGVGKTLFYQIYKSLFDKENQDETKGQFIRANCAHFGNQNSDPNIARSELFGTDKNSKFNIKVKNGLIEKAKGGVLFLEEIGELPVAVQAMLLTFIEDKKYTKVGGSTEIISDCRIIAATNNESALREDFKNRFFSFNLPPIHERRTDVLYYIYDKDPELLASLFKDEVLVLLSYNWPGNVREIERITLLMRRTLRKRNRLAKKYETEGDWWKFFKTIDLDLGGSNRHKNINLYVELEKIDADVGYLESLIQNYGLSFIGSYDGPDSYPLKKVKTDPPNFEMEEIDEYTIKIYEEYEPFEKTYRGFILYSRLFLQDHSSNKNVLRDLTECYATPPLRPGVDFNNSDYSKLNNLLKKIYFFLSGIELDKSDKWPSDYHELTNFLNQQARTFPENEFLSSIVTDDNINKKIPEKITDEIAAFTKGELLTAYYEKILELSKGNVAKARRRIDIPYSTLTDELKKYGIKK